MRALLATVGLLVLTGAAAAATPAGHTLRKSPTGPIMAVAQDGSSVAWLTSGSRRRTCNAVHLLTPGKADRILSQSAPDGMTCNWDLAEGQPQLAFAADSSTALWNLHESGPVPVDYVVAAAVGSPERQIARLAHASNGTGDHLGSVAGSGKTLAYSWEDVEYVDKLACLSGGSCKQKIADGGIRLVTRNGDQGLPQAKPALGLAVSAGRIAYIPATVAKSGRPLASANNVVYVVDATTGDSISQAFVKGIPAAIALSPHVFAVLTQFGPHDRISWFSTADGTKLGTVLVSHFAATQLAASDQLVVYRVNRTLYGVSTSTGRIRVLTKAAADTTGYSLGKNLLVWTENQGGTGRLRGLATG